MSHPAVEAAEGVADELLAGASASDDPARGVREETLRDLARRGLVSVAVPESGGGFGGDERVAAEVEEVLAGADAATWFVLTQHRTPQRLTGEPRDGGEVRGPASDRHRDALARGDALGGIAVAHLRRPGPPAVRARPDGAGGWRLDGRSDWCTGWGLVDLVLVAARDAEQIVFSLIPATQRPGLRASDPLGLAVMGGTRTVTLDFDDMAVAADEVAATMNAATWHRRDADTVVDTKPATLGLLRRVIAETERIGYERDRPAALEAAAALAAEAGPLRERAYALTAGQGPVDERVALRGRVAELTVRAANGLVAARGGSAMLLTSHEQRWCREAAFHLVQAQTDLVRAEQLAAFGHRDARRADWRT